MTPQALALPLAGIKVADFSQGVAGPHCAMLLAGHGADVIKIEPLEGDWGRRIGPQHADYCADALAFNRGKRSLALNLKIPQAKQLALEVASDADVVIESFRPGVMTKFGLDYDAIRQINPRVIYLSVTGFGQRGPMRDRPATDLVIQSFAGLMSMNQTPDGVPQRVGMILVDVVAGLYACQAILGAILRQQRFGQGAYIDCNLMQCAAAFQSAKLIEQHLNGGPPPHHFTPVGVLKTLDGHISVSIRTDDQWNAFCREIDRDDLATDRKFSVMASRNQHQAELMDIVGDIFRRRPNAEWVDILTRIGAHNSPVMTYADFMADPQVTEMNTLAWVDQDGIGKLPLANIPGLEPIEVSADTAQTPHIGQHTCEILQEIGYDASDINAFLANGVCAQFSG